MSDRYATPTIDVVVDLKTTLGEGPLWDCEQQLLYWIDSADGRIFRSTAEGSQIRAWDVGQKIGSMALCRDGAHAIVALQNGLSKLDLADGTLTELIDPEADLPNNRLNDGKVDKRGRFVFGSMDTLEESASGKLYSYRPDGSLAVLDEGITVSNGPCWSPDGETLYFCDTWTGEIWAYDYDLDTGAVANRRTFARVDTSSGGAADGATVDADGYLWQALVYGGKIIRYAPDGSVDRVIDFPVRKPTSVMFGGADLDVLYVTSMARPPLPRFPGDGQLRGSLFAIRGLGVHGIPETRFGA
ncbi:SMP-30/gluconolactonase/LRE family protein [Mycolicibacterium wolinskyi]|uniref:Calcium-binding protein n=1 Tax=Mycolicibacterium wolinskyi TaxID=59750 RepID=A0A1X2FAK8_9MYCO|nr:MULTISPECIES: SMP-30/gluconolactonase/LRE family protein [Mycolicibacterium]MCV7285399.1 SMP-30/gluconolactonase/LRE family protein [Mycolicibacterium wolinskyi]MCV7295098.1 SMP-30/gluconolactonase/LRE family protein [Mycolicibacterium goodii]ORX15368.1 calcium-binding protein [Mycolicibacterium wolinskyi]